MSFRDYSNTPGDNTTLGDGTYIGPNMLRNKVRPALQQIAADGRELRDEMIALGGGGALPAFIAAGAGAVEEPAQTWSRRVGIWPEQFGSRVSGFDDARLQKALDALPNKGRLYLADDFVIANGLLLADRHDVTIYGPGSITLDAGAPDQTLMLQLSGTCDGITFDGLRLYGPGRGDTAARHQGISNFSGAILSRILTKGCLFQDLNLGVAYNAESAGSFVGGQSLGNTFLRMKGTVGGQGYGFFASGAFDIVSAFDKFDYTERHAVYYSKLAASPGQDAAGRIISPSFRNHRQTIQGAVFRPAMYVGRGFGARIEDPEFIDFYDGAVGIGHDTGGGGAPVASSGDIELIRPKFIGRKNAIPCIQIGEPLVPTTATTQRVTVTEPKFHIDYAVAAAQYEIDICNGKGIRIDRPDFYLANALNGTNRLIIVGSSAGAGDIADVTIDNAKIRGTASTPGSVNLSLAYLPSAQATGTARIRVRDADNDTAFVFKNVEDAATRTNPNIIDRLPGQLVTGIYAAGDTTPSVAGGIERLVIANASATNITTLDDGIEGQKVMLEFSDSNTTLKYGTTMRLPSTADIVGSVRRCVVIVLKSGAWHPVSDITGS